MTATLPPMCGRFVQFADPERYARRFGVDQIEASVPPSYNVAPTATVAAVVERADRRTLGAMSWGLSTASGRRVINARLETVDTKPLFAEAFRNRRCLVPADGYFEWQSAAGRKVPHLIRSRDGEPLGLGGLWTRGECALITTAAYPALEEIHRRMPVMLHPEAWDAWLDGDVTDPDVVYSLMRNVPEDALEWFEVSPIVNDARNDVPECLQPV